MALDPDDIPVRANGQTIDETWYNILRTFFQDIYQLVEDATAGDSKIVNVQGDFTVIGNTTAMKRGVSYWPVTAEFTLDNIKLIANEWDGSTGSLSVTATRIRFGEANVNLLITNPLVLASNDDFTDSDDGLVGNIPAQMDTFLEELLPGDLIRTDLVVVPAYPSSDNTLGIRGLNVVYEITAGA